MSNSPNFFVQGRIEKDTDVYIVAKTEITGTGLNISPNIFSPSTGITSGDTMWSVLGAQQNYTPYEDLTNVIYYYYDGKSYYYPLYVNSTNEHKTPMYITQSGVSTSETNASMTLYYGEDNLVKITETDPPESTFSINGTEYYYKNAKTLVNLPLSLNGNITVSGASKTGYFYPAYLNNTAHRSTVTYSEREFYIPYGSNSNIQNKTEDPKRVEDAEAKLILYNPYQSVMNNLFRIEQSSTQNQGIKLSLSSSIGNPSVKKFKNVRLDDQSNLICSNTGDSQFFNFKPQGVKIDNRNIYAGVGYKINPSDNINTSPSFNIVNNKVTRNTEIIKEAGIEYSPDSIPNPNSFLISSDPFSYESEDFDANSTDKKNTQGTPLSDTELTTDTVSGINTTLYFIPYQMYQVSTNSRSEYTGYDPIQFLITSPQVFNLRPKILHGPLASGNTNYFKWVNEVRISSDPSELAFTTKGHDAHSRIVTRYCNTNEFCGKCFGVCNPKNTLNPSNLCILDTESVSEFNKGEDYFTCDHDRYVNSSDYVKNGTISHHSNSFILILIILAIVIGAGIILFEERKMILKHVLSTKNGR